MLASFIQHDVFKIYPCSTWIIISFFMAEQYSLGGLCSVLLVHPLLLNICVMCPFEWCTFEHLWTSICKSTSFKLLWASVHVWCRPRIMCLDVSHAVSTSAFDLLRDHQTSFCCSSTTLHCYQQCVWVLILQHPWQQSLTVVLFFFVCIQFGN